MKPSRLVTLSIAVLLIVTPLVAKPAKKTGASTTRCSLAHYPIAVGDVNEYRMTSKQLDAEKKVIETTSYTYRDEVIAVDHGGYKTKSVSEGNTSESEWGCSDEGISLKFAEYPQTKITTTGVTVPAKMEVGEAWNQTFESESPGSSQKTKTVNRITKREEVVVPAGTFDAYRVDYEVETTITGQEPTVARGTQWFASNVGIVKSVSVVDMDAGEIRGIETTIELVKRTTK